MKERGIIFNAEMVRALLDGLKTQTRRPINPQPELTARSGFSWKGNLYGSGSDDRETNINFSHVACPFGKPGDRIWVREAFRMPASLDHISPKQAGELSVEAGAQKPWSPLFYEFTGSFSDGWKGFETPPKVAAAGKLRPSIHMPRWASRIQLEITTVRVERLQEITLRDICKEIGCGLYDFRPATHGFQVWEEIWQSIYGGDSFQANPWVWVIEFKRIEGTAA